ncbi:ribonuclease E/G [Azospirillum picis]|uniref:Ribonuclease E/ribonuclease G n=1 Tax=Azospirillum picis TaxID=488438 RepID=A0ABU0MDT3_9PROT|nr:ribonuclease E/G [Azospirillum picis]MBP2297382.1 ribonuclease E/ribonuclease G [Azospirillum picis]MDQ0531595.1 ribonuclease E/ribonuclease G [Azospirillum picis]
MTGSITRRELLVDRDGPLTRAALLAGGRLTDLHIDHAGRPSLLGSIILGRVERIATGLNGAFIDLGNGVSGLLPAADVRQQALDLAGTAAAPPRSPGRPGGKPLQIGTLLRTGQPVIVQVKADAAGAKGPSLTMDVTLPGRFLVHAPLGRDIAVSKRLGSGPERAALAGRLEGLVTGAGWIVRAGAGTADDGLLAAESEALHLQWRAVRDGAGSGSAPRLLRSGPDAATRALIELGGATPDAILVDDGPLLSTLRSWCNGHAPDLLGRIEAHKAPPRLFDLRDLDSAIAALLDPRIPLPLGGSLVIERTEALTVVDVNAGERGNPLDVNLDAAAEIARQLRLRNVGGIVVVDFVNMRGRGDAERILAALARAVEDDPVQTQVYGMSKLGLVELTRARRGTPLSALLQP